MIIYKATNTINGKGYIGQTRRDLTKRIKEHIYDSTIRYSKQWFHQAIRKYGIDNFEWEVLCECSDLKELSNREIEFIELYKTFGGGYNMTKGGGNSVEMTNEIKKKISDAVRKYFKENPMTAEMRNKISITHKGRKFSNEHIQKLKENHGGGVSSHTEETRQKISESMMGDKNHFYGKHHTEETKQILKEKGINCIKRTKLYKIITPDNKVIIIRNLRNFCRENNLTRELMNQVIWGKQNHHKGYKCEYYQSD